MTRTFLGEVLRRLLQPDLPASTKRHPGEQLVHGRALCQASKLTCEVLLERLAALLCPALQCRVHLVRNVSYQHVGHAYMMQASQLHVQVPDTAGMPDLYRRWRIVEVDDAWDLDLDVEEPAHLDVGQDGHGEMVFFLLGASVDARRVSDARFDFTWKGQWENDEQSGRDVAELGDNGDLRIHLWIHFGDELLLRATPT